MSRISPRIITLKESLANIKEAVEGGLEVRGKGSRQLTASK